jgi:hypothetical protein
MKVVVVMMMIMIIIMLLQNPEPKFIYYGLKTNRYTYAHMCNGREKCSIKGRCKLRFYSVS